MSKKKPIFLFFYFDDEWFQSLPEKSRRSHVTAGRKRSGLGVEHLQQQFVERDVVLAVQPQEGLHGSVGGLSQQREAHQQAARPVLLPARRLVLLQGLVEPVLEPLHQVRAVHRVGV